MTSKAVTPEFFRAKRIGGNDLVLTRAQELFFEHEFHKMLARPWRACPGASVGYSTGLGVYYLDVLSSSRITCLRRCSKSFWKTLCFKVSLIKV
jgi:hypothetical protein